MIAASASKRGASRELFRRAKTNDWVLVTTPYALEEVLRHLPEFPVSASSDWVALRSLLLVMDDIFTMELPVVFPVTKDRPILFGALAWSDILLTLDRGDFETFLGKQIYDLPILT